MKMTRIDFYKSFLNCHFMRDYRHIQSNGRVSVGKPNNFLIKYDKITNTNLHVIMNDYTEKVKSYALSYLNRKSKENYRYDGNLAYSLSFFKDFVSYCVNDNKDRFTDRLMFDFDVSDARLKELKKKVFTINKNFALSWKERQKEKEVVQGKFRDLLFNSDVLDVSLSDAQKLANYFHDEGLETYPVFSGSKGVHLYVFIPPVQSIMIKEAVRKYSILLKETLHLDTLDLAVVKNVVKGVDRIPYSKHESTGLYVTPFDFHDDKETILKKRSKQEVEDFSIPDYDTRDFVKDLIVYNKKLLQEEEEKRKIAKQKRDVLKVKFKSNNKKFVYVNLREFARDYIGSPAYEFDNYDSYLCPFHNDNRASASVYENGLICGVCGNMKPYEVIGCIIGTSDYEKILEVAYKYKK